MVKENNNINSIIDNMYSYLSGIARMQIENKINNNAFVKNELMECEFILKDLYSNIEDNTYYGDCSDVEEELTEQIIY